MGGYPQGQHSNQPGQPIATLIAKFNQGNLEPTTSLIQRWEWEATQIFIRS